MAQIAQKEVQVLEAQAMVHLAAEFLTLAKNSIELETTDNHLD